MKVGPLALVLVIVACALAAYALLGDHNSVALTELEARFKIDLGESPGAPVTNDSGSYGIEQGVGVRELRVVGAVGVRLRGALCVRLGALVVGVLPVRLLVVDV